jgi:quercetin dioxygenase-like cupin family protein
MNKEFLSLNRMVKSGAGMIITPVMKGEVKDADFLFLSLKGDREYKVGPPGNALDVLLTLQGSGHFVLDEEDHPVLKSTIIRVPFGAGYTVTADSGRTLHFLRIRRSLDGEDLAMVKRRKEEFARLWFKALDDCPTYSEDIKSEKTINRMILPEGLVPRFAMGSVETTGPDEVGEHEHPMLDQIFLGLQGCRCYCYADGEEDLLTENVMLHIPLGSRHHVEVRAGDKLAYIWMDFFLTLEGEKYMREQHQMDNDGE